MAHLTSPSNTSRQTHRSAPGLPNALGSYGLTQYSSKHSTQNPLSPNKLMSPKPLNSLLQIWLVLAILLGTPLAAQAQNQTFPTYQGSNGRQGHNAGPTNDFPGRAYLSWFFPSFASNYTETQSSNQVSFSSGWAGPTLVNAASGYYVAPPTTPIGQAENNADLVTGTGYLPPYYLSQVTPSSTTNVLAAAPGAPVPVQTFSWKFSSAANQLPAGVPGDYGLSVWTPVGPTVDGVTGNYDYPQRYFVYLVQFGTNQTATYIVDQQSSRGGWNRLGGTNTLFHYDGVNPITVTLYNTIPRDSSGNLLGVGTVNSVSVPVNYYVYANAAQISPNQGTNIASPVLGTDTANSADPYPTRVVSASNLPINGEPANSANAQNQGVVTSIPFGAANSTTFGIGNPYWTFTPALANNAGYTFTYPSSAVSASSGWTQQTAATPFYQGSSYFSAPITTAAATAQAVTYAPNLAAGYYGVYIWTPGTANAGTTYGTVRVSITELGVTTNYEVNEATTNGYVQVGGRLFYNNYTSAPLTVQITNLDDQGIDAPGSVAFANAVQFVGNVGLAVNSTPVYANVNIQTPSGPQMKAVNIIASEDGHIYCVDAMGRGDGTTDVYWVYPSLPNSNVANYIDPNQASGVDGTVTNGVGVTIAEMPTGFNTTSALVQEVPVGSGNYYLYIGSTNGRVYCIDMKGRGDYVTSTRTAGTTDRVWSYPNDYPATAVVSTLGSITQTIAYNTNAAGPTIFVPTPQGRMYALDAVGTPAQHITTPRWTFPALTSPVIGAVTTPAIDGATGNTPNVYFGTQTLNGNPGYLYSLNSETGALNWQLNGTNPSNGSATRFDDFDAAPTTAFNGLVGDGKNYVFIGNENGFVYAFDDSGNLLWQTDETSSGVSQPLLFTNILAYTNGGTYATSPVPSVVVPTDNGVFYGMYAGQSTVNSVGTKSNWYYGADGDQIRSGMAAGNQFMYGTDDHGYLYAFSNFDLLSSGSFSGTAPGGSGIVPNNPIAQAYANAKVAFLTKAQYTALMTKIQAGQQPDYATFTNSNGFLNRTAFDFGETLYLFVYNFPYNPANAQVNGQPQQGVSAIPTTVNFTFSVAGTTQRSVPSESFQFGGTPPQNEDGFAVVPYTLQPSGGLSLAPGNGYVSFTMGQYSANSARLQTIIANPLNQRIAFSIANPLGFGLLQQTQPLQQELLYASSLTYGTPMNSLGADTVSFADPTNEQNQFNGTENILLKNAQFNPASMLTSAGYTSHGQTGNIVLNVYDRSLMGLVNGPDNGGLSGIRVQRDNLAWNGGYLAVVSPLSGTNSIFAGLNATSTIEDYPVNSPNNSLDYPDMQQQNVAVTQNPLGSTTNPLFSPGNLPIPNGLFVPGTSQPTANPSLRTPVPTPFEIDISVPHFQPANMTSANDTTGTTLGAGYEGQFRIYIDSNNNGILDLNNGRREAYRAFQYATGVAIDQHLDVITPSVDLGTLASGTGLLPSGAISSSTVYSPWYLNDLGILPTQNTPPAYQESALYQSFRVLNIGNVNLPSIRLAKAYNGVDWPLVDSANDSLSYLDGGLYIFSDLDPAFSLSGPNYSNLLPGGALWVQKSRITEVSGTEVLTNQRYKANANTGHTGSLTDTFLSAAQLGGLSQLANPGSPRVGVTPPIGFPSGSYTATLRVFDNSSGNLTNLSLNNGEPYSDPTFTLSFNVAETRLTNGYSINPVVNPSVQSHFGTFGTNFFTGTEPMADYGLLSTSDIQGTPTEQFIDANVQPAAMRDLFGNLTTIWSSNRPATGTAVTSQTGSVGYRLFLANLIGTAPNQASGTSPLHDLGNNVAATANQWFSVTQPYPAGPTVANTGVLNSLFQINPNERLLGSQTGENDSVRFGQPAFPLYGQVNPTNTGQSLGQVLFGFTGSAIKVTPGGQSTVERLFLGSLTPNNNAAPTLSAPIAIAEEPGISTGKVSVVQTGTTASIFYSAGSSSEKHIGVINYANGAVQAALTVPLGNGFLSATDPSASFRVVDAELATSQADMEVAFSGKLRGRPNSEIFLARLATANGLVAAQGTSSNAQLQYFNLRSGEQLASTGNKGEFRAQGVEWNTSPTTPINTFSGTPFDISVATAGNTPVSILGTTAANAQPFVQDPQSGVYRVATTMGTVVVDPTVGTIKFTSTIPGPNVQVFASYQPAILRLSSGTSAGYTAPSFVFENHLVGSSNYDSNFVMYDRYWYINGQHPVLTNGTLRDARFFVTYNGGASSSNTSSRPYYETLRFGIQLPFTIPLLTNGDVDFSQFNVNANGPIQCDPSTGRVYFTSLDEDNIVTVTYKGNSVAYQVGLINEKNELPVPMDRPLQENGLTAFIDPFDPGAVGSRRPPLLWMFWSSNRKGPSDIYFQTISPQLYPSPSTVVTAPGP